MYQVYKSQNQFDLWLKLKDYFGGELDMPKQLRFGSRPVQSCYPLRSADKEAAHTLGSTSPSTKTTMRIKTAWRGTRPTPSKPSKPPCENRKYPGAVLYRAVIHLAKPTHQPPCESRKSTGAPLYRAC